jgi:hypothetical protein
MRLRHSVDRLHGHAQFPRDHDIRVPSWAHNAIRATNGETAGGTTLAR